MIPRLGGFHQLIQKRKNINLGHLILMRLIIQLNLLTKNGEDPGIGFALFPLTIKSNFTSETSKSFNNLVFEHNTSENIPENVKSHISSNTLKKIDAGGKSKDIKTVTKAVKGATKEVVRGTGSLLKNTGTTITAAGYIAAPFTDGASLGLVPIGNIVAGGVQQ